MNFRNLFFNFTMNPYLRCGRKPVPAVQTRTSRITDSCGLRLTVFLFFLCFNLTSCSSQKLAVREIPIERDGQRIVVVKAEIASTQEERTQGLMYRKELPDGEGMLFIFERDQVLSFWMKNTYIPLSIAYITSDGRIVEIKDMYPHDESSVLSSRSVRYALEVPQNWFSRAGVLLGDIVTIDLENN